MSLPRWLFWLAILALALAVPAGLDGYGIHTVDVALIFAILAVGLSLTQGVAGQTNLAQVALFGIGAYTTAVLTTAYHWDYWASLPASVVLALAAGVILGLPALRMQSHYLGIVTLGLAIAFSSFAANAPLLGGAAGISAIPGPALLGFAFNTGHRYYFLLLGALALGLLFAGFICGSGLGLRLKAIRDDHVAAAATGINVATMRVAAFALGALFAGLAGSLYAGLIGYVSPDTFSIFVMFELLAMVMIGGRQSIYGSAAGAILITVVQSLLINFQNYAQLGYGVLQVAVVVAAPMGLAGLALRTWRTARRQHTGQGVRVVPYAGRLAGVDAIPPSNTSVISVAHLNKRFGALSALDDINLDVRSGTIHGIVGPNGSGKTTLFNVLTGLYRADGGAVTVLGASVLRRRPDQLASLGVARTFQNVRLFRTLTVLENTQTGALRSGSGRAWEYFLTPWRAASRDRDTRRRAVEILEDLGLTDVATLLPSELPYGVQRRVEIARALASAPRLLLLDEPAAGLNGDEVRELGDILRDVRRSGVDVVLIEHNMALVMSLCDRVTVLNFGRLLIDSEPAIVSRDPSVIEAYLGRHDRQQSDSVVRDSLVISATATAG